MPSDFIELLEFLEFLDSDLKCIVGFAYWTKFIGILRGYLTVAVVSTLFAIAVERNF